MDKRKKYRDFKGSTRIPLSINDAPTRLFNSVLVWVPVQNHFTYLHSGFVLQKSKFLRLYCIIPFIKAQNLSAFIHLKTSYFGKIHLKLMCICLFVRLFFQYPCQCKSRVSGFPSGSMLLTDLHRRRPLWGFDRSFSKTDI